MNIKTFIERAIEGGWTAWDTIRAPHSSAKEFDKQRCGDCFCTVQELHTHLNLQKETEAILLDPRAWQAVGKVSGWNECCSECGCTTKKEVAHHGDARGEACTLWEHEWWDELSVEEYRYRMHRFIDALCDGKDLEGAVEEATK